MEISSVLPFLIVVSLATLSVECRKLETTAADDQSGQIHLPTCPCSKRKYSHYKKDRPASSTTPEDLSNEYLRQRDPPGSDVQQVIDFIGAEKCGCGCRHRTRGTAIPKDVATTTEATTVSMTDLPMTTDEEASTLVYDIATTTVSSGYKYNRTCNNDSSECIVLVSYPNKSDVTLKYRRCYPLRKCPTPSRAQSTNEEKTNKDDGSSSPDKASGGAKRPHTEEQIFNGGSSSQGSSTYHHTGYSLIGHQSSISSSHRAAGDHTYSMPSQTTAGFHTHSEGPSQSTFTYPSTSTTSDQGSKPSYAPQTSVGPSSESNESKPIHPTQRPGSGDVEATYAASGSGGKEGNRKAGSGGGGYSLIASGFTYRGPVRTTPRTTTIVPPIEELANLSKSIPSPPDCGLYNERLFNKITGGRPSQVGKWPWLVAYGYGVPEGAVGQITWMCGGALVTAKCSITAAHCLEHPTMKLMKARFGDLDLDDDEDGATPITEDVSHGIKHPLYNKNQHNHDIAIVVLKSPLRFKDTIKPICLPFGNDMRNEMFNDMEPYIAGWGNLDFRAGDNSMLYEVQIPIVSNEQCAKVYNALGRTVRRSHICAGGNRKDSCQGDSGGPLMVPWNHHFYTIGVVSWGFRCGTPGYPGVYTRITSYLDWLQDNLT